MSSLPGAIIFINRDISDAQKIFIGGQLIANEIISKVEFDARVSVDPNYPEIVKNSKSRVIVILSTFQDLVNRDLADVSLFFSHGQAAIEYKGIGPPRLSIDQRRLDIYTILRYVKSDQVKQYQYNNSSCCGTQCSCTENDCRCCHDINCPSCIHGLGGIFQIQKRRTRCGVHAANCDNMAHNEKYKNRNY